MEKLSDETRARLRKDVGGWTNEDASGCTIVEMLSLLDERDALAVKLEAAEARADKFQALWNETQCVEFDTGYQITRKLKIAEARIEEPEAELGECNDENERRMRRKHRL